MDFLAAPLMWGMLAASVPLVLHLTGRAHPVTHRFAAMRFLVQSRSLSSRFKRFRQWLLLLLRMLLVAGVALTLARPLWPGPWLRAVWLGSGLVLALLAGAALCRRAWLFAALALLGLVALHRAGPVKADARTLLRGDFVLVVDDSMSMAYQEPRGTRLELARTQALSLLDRLAPDARVALLPAGSAVERTLGHLSVRHDLARQRLRELSPSGGAMDFAAALQAAAGIVQRERRNERNAPAWIVVFSDMQAANFSALKAQRIPDCPKNTAMVLVSCAAEAAYNGAAFDLRLSSPTLPADSTATALGKIRVPGRGRPCLAEMYVDERREWQKLLDPQGQDILAIEAQFPTGAPGPHVLRLSLVDSDPLPFDQNSYCAYTAGPPARGLILETKEAAPNPARGGSAFFLRSVLQARRDGEHGEDTGASGLDFDVEPAGELTAAKLARCRVVILADCGKLSDASWNVLRQWCEAGGGLFVWLGPHTGAAAVERYGFQEQTRNHGLLPGKILPAQEFKQPLSIMLADPSHPVLAHMTAGTAALLRATRVRNAARIFPQVQDNAVAVLLGLSDGTPFLLEKTCGRGRVLLCAADPGLEWTDLPRHAEAFVTLVLDATRYLAGGEKPVEARIGQPLALPLPELAPGQEVQWFKPGALEPERLQAQADEAFDARDTTHPSMLPLPPLERPGVHRFFWDTRGANAKGDGKAGSLRLTVNVDAAESALAEASPESIRNSLPGWAPQLVKDLGELQAFEALNGGTGGVKQEFAAALLLVLGALLLCESVLANRFHAERTESGDKHA